MTIYLCTDAAQDLTVSGALNTEASRASFAKAWVLAATRIGRAAGVTVIANGDVDGPTAADYRRRNKASGANVDAIDEVWQMVHDSVYKGSRNGRWVCGQKSTTDKYGRVFKAALKRAPRDDE